MLQSLQADISQAKKEITDEVAVVVGRVQTQMDSISQQLLDHKAAGERIVEHIEQQRALTVTEVEGVKAAAQSEFDRHRGVIEQVVNEVRGIQSSLQTLATGMQGELDTMKMELASAASLVGGIGSSGSVDSLKAEVGAMRAELLELKSLGGGGSSAPNRDGGNNRFGQNGFVPLKQMTPKTMGSKEEQWRDWVDETREYLDMCRPGMKELLMACESEQVALVDTNWVMGKTRCWEQNRFQCGER